MTHWTEDVFVDRPGVFRPDLEARVEDADAEVDALLGLLADEHGVEPTTALDVACGIGRHAVPLAERGVRVTGLDISPDYLDAARVRAAEAGVGDQAEFVEGDMRDLGALDGRYDLVTNMWTSFGYYDEETNREVLRGMRERVGEAGALVLELVNRDGQTGDGFEASGAYELDGLFGAEIREYDPSTARMSTERELFEEVEDGYEHLGTMTFEVRSYAPVELRERLLAADFETVTFYEDLGGETLTPTSARMVAVAEP